MEHAALKRSTLFGGIPERDIAEDLAAAAHRIRQYEKGETVFRLMEKADRIGIILSGRAEVQKSFPNGSRINVSVRGPGEMIGAAAVFSKDGRYPCDIVAREPVAVLLLDKDAALDLMRRDRRVLQNFLREMGSAACMLQQRLELMSYRGIAQKAAFWLLTAARQTGGSTVRIPGSVSQWSLRMDVSRPSLHRELKRLEAEGAVSRAGGMITILDEEALMAALSR